LVYFAISSEIASRRDPMYDESLNKKWKYEDPHPEDRGSLLLANRIHELCEQKLLIADFYSKENLRPASYTLRIGDDFIDSEGKQRKFTDDEDSFIFEKNSIIYVTVKEELSLPYYIIARFNLRVNWVYDGILLGTGPQVDPGFSGCLSCPLYNLTNVDLTIKRGEKFATIDFEKTTNLLDGYSLDKKKSIIAQAQEKELMYLDEEVYSFYKAGQLKPLQHHKSHRLVSSLLEMREEVRTWRRLGIGAVIAFFGLTLSLLAFGANIYRQNVDLIHETQDGKDELRTTSQRISTLQNDINRLSSGLGAATPTPPPAKPQTHEKRPK
jgi:deoxycytidine triphosphate deaminase